MSRRALVVALAIATLAACACQSTQGVAATWPTADTEHSVAGPSGPPRWPLTGLPAPSAHATRQRVVAVKVDDSLQGRPQSGIGQADIVYETMAEGGVTRFTALFQSTAPRSVGPVRSARAVDLYLVAQYHALFAHVGAESSLTRALSNRARYADLGQKVAPGPYTRSSSRPAPYNVYVDVGALRSAGAKRGFAVSRTVEGPAFVQTASTGASSAVGQIDIAYSAIAKVEWRYDSASGEYLRFTNGRADVDAATKRQDAARNVVVLWTQQSPRAHRDVVGQPGLDILLSGSGRASVFRDGEHLDGVWQADAVSPVSLTTKAGPLIRLEPGATWYEVVENAQNLIMR